MFERILIPLDGSARAELILSQVGRILRREDSEILLLRVVGPAPVSGIPEEDQTLMDGMRQEAERYVQDLVRRFEGRGAKTRGRAIVGSTADAILDVAQQESSTMIAMTTHGRTGLSRWFMGSVAEKVVRASTVPVLLVRSFRPTPAGPLEPATAEEMPFRKILLPTDGSPASLAVVAPAAAFAKLFDSEIVVLHVQAPPMPPGAILPGMEAGLPPPPAEPVPSTQDEHTAKTAELLHQAGLRIVRRTVLGDPAAEIIDRSSGTSGVDLIALTTHGRSGFSRWLTGSVTERVLRHSSVPLLIVRAAPPK
jgi:nucleotide-binding universal stress UspA family protein